MASSVIRVKRRITDEPLDKFVLNCKRMKTSNDATDNQPEAAAASSSSSSASPAAAVASGSQNTNENGNTRTILTFAATVSADDDIKEHLTRLRKTKAEEVVRKVRKVPEIIQKLREQFKDDTQNHRFKIVNFSRSEMDNDSETDDALATNNLPKDITIVDVVKEENETAGNASSNNVPNVQEQNEQNADSAAVSNDNDNDNANKFVYDLYVMQTGEQLTEADVDYLSISPFDDLYYQNNDDSDDDSDDDSEDSNNEGNWRNDYPDTEESSETDESLSENYIRRAVENIRLDDDNYLSSDSGDSFGRDPDFQNMEMDSEDEYEYFRRNGRVRTLAEHYSCMRDPQAIQPSADDGWIYDRRSSRRPLSPHMWRDSDSDSHLSD